MTPAQISATALFTLILGIGLAPAAHAQAGPLEPRLVIGGQPYPQFPANAAFDFLGATAELSVDVEGHVTDVKIVEGSGDEAFDEMVRAYYSKFRVIPALTADGQIVAGKTEVHFRIAIDSNPHAERLQGPDAYAEAEVRRIRHMDCGDFLWEYGRMQEIARGKSLDQEYMILTSFAMVQAAQRLTTAEIDRLRDKSSVILKKTVKSCRANPAASYFKDAYQPAVMAQSGR